MKRQGDKDAADRGAPGRAARETLPSHLIRLAPGWNLWRTICLRGTGFPVSLLEQFGAPDAAAAADACTESAAAAAEAKTRALDACLAERRNAKGAARTALNRARRHLEAGRVPEPGPELSALEPAFAAYGAAFSRAAAARARFDEAIVRATERESAAIAAALADPSFREAVIWQNREALRNNLLPLMRPAEGSRNNRRRRQEQLALRYIQRYAAKNESIGFFGPIGWASIRETGAALAVEPGPALVARNSVYFEYWAIAALADKATRDSRILPWLAPRRSPLIRLADGKIVYAGGRSRSVRPEAARLIGLCDGVTPAGDIARRLVADPGSGFAEPVEVFRFLGHLARRGEVIWRLDVPFAPFADRALAERLASIGDAALRAELSAPLEEIQDARERILAARGDPAALDAALADAETRFARLTGQKSVQFKTAVARGRTLVYLDCRRDAAVELGPDALARLAPPLSLVLASARWLTHEGVKRSAAAIETIFDRLSARAGSRSVDFAILWRQAFDAGVFSGVYLLPVLKGLQARWTALLPFEDGQRRVQFRSKDLREGADAAFAVPGPALGGLPYQSPDLMIAADSAGAVCRGEGLFVLGEVHAGFNTVLQTPFLLAHPRCEEIAAAGRRDAPGVRISPVMPTASDIPSRFAGHARLLTDYDLSFGEIPPRLPFESVLAIADLVAERRGGALIVRTRDGAKTFDVLDLFAFHLRGWASSSFHMLPARAHMPRITVDSLVIARETWRFPVPELTFAMEKTESGRFLEARRWAHTHGLPRRVFIRFPHEKKPLCIDLESPGFVDLAAHMWRVARDKHGDGTVTVTEMLPDLNECWLVDAQGNRYASELRLVAVESPGFAR